MFVCLCEKECDRVTIINVMLTSLALQCSGQFHTSEGLGSSPSGAILLLKVFFCVVINTTRVLSPLMHDGS